MSLKPVGSDSQNDPSRAFVVVSTFEEKKDVANIANELFKTTTSVAPSLISYERWWSSTR